MHLVHLTHFLFWGCGGRAGGQQLALGLVFLVKLLESPRRLHLFPKQSLDQMCSRLLSFCKKRGHCQTNNGIPRKHNAGGILVQSHRALSFTSLGKFQNNALALFPLIIAQNLITQRSFRDHPKNTQSSLRDNADADDVSLQSVTPECYTCWSVPTSLGR